MGVGGLSEHIRRAKEGSILKSVEVVAERKREMELGQGGGVQDVTGINEEAEVGAEFCWVPPRLAPRSSFLRATHEVDGALHELRIG